MSDLQKLIDAVEGYDREHRPNFGTALFDQPGYAGHATKHMLAILRALQAKEAGNG